MTCFLARLTTCLKRQRKLVFFCCLFSLFPLSGCSGVQFGEFLKPVNIDKMSSYEQRRLNCSIQTGLQSETDFALLGSGILSLSFRLPSSLDQDVNYDRRFDDYHDYHDCLRIAGL